MAGAIQGYDAHRNTGDPLRRQTHQTLYRTFNDCVRSCYANIIIGRNEKLPPLPCTEVELEGLFRTVVAQAKWRYCCRGCGMESSAKAAMWFGQECGNVLCLDCCERYTFKCIGCDERISRELVSAKQQYRDTQSHKVRFCCKKCTPKHESKDKCGSCGCHVVNGPSGNPEDSVTPEEIQQLSGYKCLCYACAGSYRRGECGHVDSRLYEINSIPNVEDDDRDREDIGRGLSRVCSKCKSQFDNDQGETVQHWNHKVNKVTSRTYTDLGSKRSFGVEIEVVQPKNMKPMSDDMKAYWTSKRDASLPEIGVELASTVLYGDAGLQVVKDLCDYAKKNDWRVDARAGLHLHVGLPDEKIDRQAAVAMGYHLTYDLWSSFVAPSRQRCKYCRKNSYEAAKLAQAASADLMRMILTDPAVEGRRCWVNWHAHSQHGTVEIRLHHGTLMYDKISNWIKAHTRFVDWCVAHKTHEEVYKALSGLTVREQFLLIAQDAWKDRAMGRWFRKRAKELFDGCAALPESNRQLRKRGIRPDQYKPGFNYKIGDISAHVCRLQERYYIVSEHPSGNTRKHLSVTHNGWSKSEDPVRFWTRVDATSFIKEAAANGIGPALTSLKSGKKKPILTATEDFHAAIGRLRPLRTTVRGA